MTRLLEHLVSVQLVNSNPTLSPNEDFFQLLLTSERNTVQLFREFKRGFKTFITCFSCFCASLARLASYILSAALHSKETS